MMFRAKKIEQESAERKAIIERLDRIERMLTLATKKVFSVSDLAAYIGVSEKTVRNNVQDIPHYKQNGRVYFRRSEVDEYLCREREETIPEK